MAEERCHVSTAQGKFLLVDGPSVAYRAFYAIPGLHAPNGEPTNAVYGFIRMFNRLTNEIRPTWGVVVWDGGLSPHRVQIHPGYKATRPPMPDALRSQIRRIHQFLEYAGVASIQREGVEADDLLATLAKLGADVGLTVFIATNDKDFCQLVSSRISVVSPSEKKAEFLTPSAVREKLGVPPEQVVDFLSLVGDAVDNIPGVPGVGPKTAIKLLEKYGSVDGIYRHLSEVEPERIRLSLREHQAQVERNKELIALKILPDVELNLEDYTFHQQDYGKLKEFYSALGFSTLLKELCGRVGQSELFN